MKYIFPEQFTWGAATSSYQIEGAVNDGGRGLSTWDVFCERPGVVSNGDSGAGACDHYNRWRDDIDVMRELNLAAYRFSLAWPRIFPAGDGAPNPEGVSFYDRLIDGLLEAGIDPYMTLFHWDLPQSLQERFGGWRSRETVNRFADYAAFCGEQFGDRVKNWFTINEIMCFTIIPHSEDRFAPGGILTEKEVNQTVHHALLGHGYALRALKETVPDCRVGLVENLRAIWPLYETDEHIEAARKAFRRRNFQRLYPALTGRYDEETYRSEYGEMPDIVQGDMEVIGTKADLIAYNYYNAPPVVASSGDKGYKTLDLPADYPKTDMGWGITPKGLYWTLKFSSEEFPELPIIIAENGQAADDVQERDGSVMDIGRIEYYRNHLEMCSRAIDEGAPLKGYFAWSLMDNFEWADGYSKRFGLTRVNYRTQERTIKASGRYYAEVIRANRVL
jgi:beta-glucosidase